MWRIEHFTIWSRAFATRDKFKTTMIRHGYNINKTKHNSLDNSKAARERNNSLRQLSSICKQEIPTVYVTQVYWISTLTVALIVFYEPDNLVIILSYMDVYYFCIPYYIIFFTNDINLYVNLLFILILLFLIIYLDP